MKVVKCRTEKGIFFQNGDNLALIKFIKKHNKKGTRIQCIYHFPVDEDRWNETFRTHWESINDGHDLSRFAVKHGGVWFNFCDFNWADLLG